MNSSDEIKNILKDMQDQIYLNNKKYFSCKYAGKISGYTNDYVARFCRQGKLDGITVGRNWYVEEVSLNNFIKENNLEKEKSKEERSERMVNEYKNLEKNIIVKKISKPKLEVSKVLNLPPIFASGVLKKVAVGVLALTLVSGGYIVRDANIYPIQIVKSNAQKVTDTTNQILTTTSNQLLSSATSLNNSLNFVRKVISNQLLSSASSFKHSLASNIKYLNTSFDTTTDTIADQLLTSVENTKHSLTSNAKYFNKSTNKIISNTKIEITNQVHTTTNSLNKA